MCVILNAQEPLKVAAVFGKRYLHNEDGHLARCVLCGQKEGRRRTTLCSVAQWLASMLRCYEAYWKPGLLSL